MSTDDGAPSFEDLDRRIANTERLFVLALDAVDRKERAGADSRMMRQWASDLRASLMKLQALRDRTASLSLPARRRS
jgi:hypothetical protein